MEKEISCVQPLEYLLATVLFCDLLWRPAYDLRTIHHRELQQYTYLGNPLSVSSLRFGNPSFRFEDSL